MRFGITPLEAESFKKIFNPEKGGLIDFSKVHFSDVIVDVIESGFQHCEISLDLFEILPIQIDIEEQKRIKSLKKEYDITFSAHFPIYSIELSSPNKFIREASVQSCVDSFNKFKFLEPDIDVFVIHPTGSFTASIGVLGLDSKASELVYSILTNYAIQSVKTIIKQTKLPIQKMAIENIEYPFEKTIDMINNIKGTKLCIDTAHFLGGFSGEIDLIEITNKYLDITSEIHLQDYSDDYPSPDHVALGRGKNFPIDFLRIINKYNFQGPIVFELGIKQAIESIEFIKKHVPEIEVPIVKK
ncbi:MAG: sugar phosphate isomerase/epimerase [Promethearchaeota archaeon]|nr:MAG: sugar phosphate isomerase/epimerase [Candidatus Lokiarchaeota archaeon]